MVERPTARWRELVADEKAGLASGAVDPDDAFAIELWPEPMIHETAEVLDRFDTAVVDLVEHRFKAVQRCPTIGVPAVDSRSELQHHGQQPRLGTGTDQVVQLRVQSVAAGAELDQQPYGVLAPGPDRGRQ